MAFPDSASLLSFRPDPYPPLGVRVPAPGVCSPLGDCLGWVFVSRWPVPVPLPSEDLETTWLSQEGLPACFWSALEAPLPSPHCPAR